MLSLILKHLYTYPLIIRFRYRFLALGLDAEGIIKSQEQIQAEQQQAMMQQLSQQGMGAAAESGGKAAGEEMGGGMAQQMMQQMGASQGAN